jgi:hypothetical protein
MSAVDAKIIAVVGAIKQAFETSGSPGLSVNSHPNHFFLNVNGAVDLKRAAELVIARLEALDADLKAKAEALFIKSETENVAANDLSVPV